MKEGIFKFILENGTEFTGTYRNWRKHIFTKVYDETIKVRPLTLEDENTIKSFEVFYLDLEFLTLQQDIWEVSEF